MDFREIGATDVGALQTLLESVSDYSQRVTGSPTGPSDALSALRAVPPDRTVDDKFDIGMWDGHQLVAFADVVRGYPAEDIAYIGLLIVDGCQQGRGLGRGLHGELLRVASGWAGIRRMRLSIVATNASRADPFWWALGYRPTGEVRPYQYDSVDSAVALWERPLRTEVG
ncbi:GNAT family N-acetyltransferase [Dermatophilaceae bacterium Sec6.4]